jgi:hypothetical protein
VKAGRIPEDSRAEFKAEWTAPPHAARRLAGCANAARGDVVVWVIGIDQTGRVTNAPRAELANWWPQVERCFDGLAPELVRDLDVPVGTDGRVVALLFHTSRAPYVVKNAKGGEAIAREVPWRVGTRVESATREQLLRVLVPTASLPTVQLLEANLVALVETPVQWKLTVRFYVVPTTQGRMVMPFYKCAAVIAFVEKAKSFLFSIPAMNAAETMFDSPFIRRDGKSQTIGASATEIIIDGPGLVELFESRSVSLDIADYDCPRVELVLALGFAGLDLQVETGCIMQRETPKRKGPANRLSWRFDSRFPGDQSST